MRVLEKKKKILTRQENKPHIDCTVLPKQHFLECVSIIPGKKNEIEALMT